MKQIFIGTYTEGTGSQGIYTLLFNEQTGRFTQQSHCSACKNPSFVIRRGPYLFAAEELEDRGQVASFRIAPDGQLTRLSEQTVPGSLTCHLRLNAAGTHLYAANYGSGCYFACPVEDGRLGPVQAHWRDQGRGPNPLRQEGPHAHSVNFTLDGAELLVADLGTDRVMRYLAQADGALVPHPRQPALDLPAGEGPRHLAFHPNGRWLYVVTELGNRVFLFTLKDGVWRRESSVPTLPPDFSDDNLAADIHISPDGGRLFASNRGKDDVAVFRIDARTGALTELCRVDARGKTPRNFALLDGGRYLAIANQEGNNLVVYEADNFRFATEIALPAPVCICAE